ncbi:MAG: hypothetical protein V7643_2475, partial [Mycobacterium sp.]
MQLGDVHVAEESLMPATQLVRGQRPRCQRLAAEKHLPHVEMLAAAGDISARPPLLRASSSGPRSKCSLAGKS